MYTSVCVTKIWTITVSWIIHGNEESHTLHFLLFLHTFWFLVKESLSHLFTLFLIYIYRIMQKTEIWDQKLFVYVCMYVCIFTTSQKFLFWLLSTLQIPTEDIKYRKQDICKDMQQRKKLIITVKMSYMVSVSYIVLQQKCYNF